MPKKHDKYQKEFNIYKKIYRKVKNKSDFRGILRFKYHFTHEQAGIIYDSIKLDKPEMFFELMKDLDKFKAENEKLKREEEEYKEQHLQEIFEEQQEEQRMRNNIYDIKELLKAIYEELKSNRSRIPA